MPLVDRTNAGPDERLIDLAAKLADRTSGPNNARWLANFRRYYRHLAVSHGDRFQFPDLAAADAATDKAVADQ